MIDVHPCPCGNPTPNYYRYGDAFRRSWWDAHHVHAVCKGGGSCGLDNYETLCVRCHKRETAALVRKPVPVDSGQGILEVGT